MLVTFLGTGGAVPTTERNVSALAIQREGDRLLFDCGEGTQRQMMRYSTGFAVSDVFLTHIHGDHVLGLPGLVQTWEFNDREDPLTVHVPAGAERPIDRLLSATGNEPSFPLDITEISPGEVALRAEEYEVRAFETDHRGRSVGFTLVEDERKGRFDRERAEELGVPAGPMFSTLHEGEAVELDDGTVIHPEQVVGPARPGRHVVYTGDTRPTDTTVAAARDADLLVHEATFATDRRDRAVETGHSTARQAARIARRAGARRLALTHVSSRYAGDVQPLEDEAQVVYDEAFVPDDGDQLEIPYPPGPDAATAP